MRKEQKQDVLDFINSLHEANEENKDCIKSKKI